MYLFQWLLLCERSTIEMNSRRAGIWAYLPILHPRNWKRPLGQKEHEQQCKGGSGGSEGCWGGPQSRNYKLSTEYGAQYNQQRISTRVSWWSSQAAECASYSPINSWPCSRLQVFNSKPAQIHVFGAQGLGHQVHREEMGLGCCYARCTGGGWNESWKDFHLGCSGNALQIGHWESCDGVATVHFMGEYPRRVGDCGSQWLSRHCWWSAGVVSAAEIEFCAPPSVGDAVKTTRLGSSTDFSASINPGGDNSRSAWDLRKCYQREDTSNRFQTR